MKDRIKEARMHAGLSQRELAKIIDVNNSSIALAETGKRTPRVGTLKLIAEATGVSFEWLKTGNGSMLPGDKPPEPDTISTLVAERGLSPEIEIFIRKLISLTPDQMVAVTDFLIDLARELQELPREGPEEEETEEEGKSIDERVEAYRQALLLEQDTEESGAS